MDSNLKHMLCASFTLFCLFAFTCGIENTVAFIAALGPVGGVILMGVALLLYKVWAGVKASTDARRARRQYRPPPENPYRNPDLR